MFEIMTMQDIRYSEPTDLKSPKQLCSAQCCLSSAETKWRSNHKLTLLCLPRYSNCIETVAPSCDHYCIDIVVPSSDHCCTETVPPSSDHYKTMKVAPPSDQLHHQFWGGHGPRASPSLTTPLTQVGLLYRKANHLTVTHYII